MAVTHAATRNVALIYVRVSRLDAKDADRALSPRTQVEQCKALPALRGMSVEVIEDLDVSGKNTERRGYQEMLARLDRGDVAVIAAYSLSRISRSVADFYRLYEGVLRPHGVAFVSATEAIDTTTPQGRAFMGMTAVWAQMEREVTADRVADNLASKAATGALVGPLPAGYVRSDGKVVIDEQSGEVVRLIFSMYATGAHSFKSLARALNVRGVQPPQKHNVGRGARPVGSPVHAPIFTADSIKDLLSNPRYVGRVPLRDGRVVVGTHPVLVDAATYEACERIRLAQRGPVKREPGAVATGSPYMLSGVLRCSACGSTMSGHTRTADRAYKKTRRVYICYRRRVAGGCAAPTVRQEVVEADLLAVLQAMALPVGFARAVDRAVAARMRTFTEATTTSAEALTAREKRLTDVYLAGRILKPDYDREWQEIQQQRATLTSAAPAPLFSQQQSVLQTLVAEWDGMTTDERKRMLAAIFDSVTASADGVDRLEPCEDWRPYIVAAIPKERALVPAERKTGLEPAVRTLARCVCGTAA
jgi:site-specific DNA recombinase